MDIRIDDYFKQDERVEVMSGCQQDIEMHSHPFLEMVYITGGQALHTLGDNETMVGQGDYFIIDYRARHKYTLVDEHPFTLVNILLKPGLIDKTLEDCQSFKTFINHYLIRINYTSLKKDPAGVIYHDDDGTIRTIVECIIKEFDEKSSGYIELIRGYIIEIIIRAMRTISKGSIDPIDNNAGVYLKEYIDKNYMKPITLSRLSREMNYSLSYLCRKFKQENGVTFVTYLQQKRMEQSARLIVNTDKQIDEIAELVGYQDMKFFQSVFKAYWSMTPSGLRKFYGG